jgi:hypothetical protein
LGFASSLLTNKDIEWRPPGNYLFATAVLVFMIAVALDICLMWTRLQDFRVTAKKLRLRLGSTDPETLKTISHRAGFFGRLNWGMYRSQLLAFGFGVLFLVISLVFLLGDRIFPPTK